MKTKKKEKFIIEVNKIYNEDCIEFMKKLPDQYLDLIIADPPYYKMVKNDWDNQWKTEQEYIKWCLEWINESYRILKNDGNFFIWGGLGEKNIAFARLIVAVEDCTNFIRKNIITVKRTKGRGSSKNVMPCREEILWIVKNKNNSTFNKSYTTDLKQQYGYKRNKDKPDFKVTGNVWTDIVFPWWGSKDEKYINDCQKPLKACNRIIEMASNENELVYIPFAGSGSEIESCIKNSRNWLATETNKKYIDEIIEPRIKNII